MSASNNGPIVLYIVVAAAITAAIGTAARERSLVILVVASTLLTHLSSRLSVLVSSALHKQCYCSYRRDLEKREASFAVALSEEIIVALFLFVYKMKEVRAVSFRFPPPNSKEYERISSKQISNCG